MSEAEKTERIISNARELYELLLIAHIWCERTGAPESLLDAITKVITRIGE